MIDRALIAGLDVRTNEDEPEPFDRGQPVQQLLPGRPRHDQLELELGADQMDLQVNQRRRCRRVEALKQTEALEPGDDRQRRGQGESGHGALEGRRGVTGPRG